MLYINKFKYFFQILLDLFIVGFQKTIKLLIILLQIPLK